MKGAKPFPNPSEGTLAAARERHAKGDLVAAAAGYEEWLISRPDDTAVLALLGTLELQRGRAAEAERRFAYAARTAPPSGTLLRHWGDALSFLGRHAEAEQRYREALQRESDDPVARLHLGNALRAQGRLAEAMQTYESLATRHPLLSAAHLQRGLVQSDLGHFEDALPCFLRARELGLTTLAVSLGIAQAHLSLEAPAAAETEARAALDRFPGEPRLLALLGDALRARGRFDEAEACLASATATPPVPWAAWYARARLWLETGRAAQADEVFRQLLPLAPHRPEILQGRAAALQSLGNKAAAEDLAEELVRRFPDFLPGKTLLALLITPRLPSRAAQLAADVLARTPHDADALAAAGGASQMLGDRQRGLELLRQAAGQRFNHPLHASTYLHVAAYTGEVPQDQLLSEARQWSHSLRRHPLPPLERAPVTLNRPLRIGYLSPDFRDHAVASFIEPVLAGHRHRPDAVAVTLFSQANRLDETTQRLRALVGTDGWHSVATLDDRRAAELIRRQRIDVLVDLAGHTRGHRLGILAQRAAPVQATYLGYFATTGLDELDYWIGDHWLFPDGVDDGYTEDLWRLPRCWLAYTPPNDCPEPAAPPNDAPFTFGSFNNLLKLSGATVSLWARAIRAVPNSRLLLRARSIEDRGQRDRITGEFAREGVSSERLLLRPPTDTRASHLAQYGEVDLALDPTPFTGGTTTAESLWMGVPVLTLPGRGMPSRMTLSMLSATGLTRWVATDHADYVERARTAAHSRAKLSQAARTAERRMLRQRVAASTLGDGVGLAEELRLAFETMLNRTLERR